MLSRLARVGFSLAAVFYVLGGETLLAAVNLVLVLLIQIADQTKVSSDGTSATKKAKGKRDKLKAKRGYRTWE